MPRDRVIRWSQTCYEISAPNLNLDDYAVCELLTPQLVFLVEMVEGKDLRVGRIEIRVTTDNRIRVYPLEEDSRGTLSFVEAAIHPNTLMKLELTIGREPTPWPEPEIPRESSQLLLRLDQVIIDQSPVDDNFALVLHAHDYADVRKYWTKRLEPITQAHFLRMGYFAILDNKVHIHCSKHVPIGFVAVGTTNRERLTPDLDQAFFFRISTRHPCNTSMRPHVVPAAPLPPPSQPPCCP